VEAYYLFQELQDEVFDCKKLEVGTKVWLQAIVHLYYMNKKNFFRSLKKKKKKKKKKKIKNKK